MALLMHSSKPSSIRIKDPHRRTEIEANAQSVLHKSRQIVFVGNNTN